jgi:pimeloyl-ACP methyl ester carboxylesterase
MHFSIRPYRRFTMCCAQLISYDWLRGCMHSAYIILILVLAGCIGRQAASPPPPSQQAACLSEQTNASCFYWREKFEKKNHKLIIFVHGAFSTPGNTWGDAIKGPTWPGLVRRDNRFEDFDIYLLNYRSTYFNAGPSIYEMTKRELARLRDDDVFNQYENIYFIAHSMGGLVVKSLLKQLNRSDVALLRKVKAVVFLGTPAQGTDLATIGKWFSPNRQVEGMESAHLNALLTEMEDEWTLLMDERKEAQFPRAFCGYEMRPYVLGYIVVPRETAFSRCDVFQGLDLDHSELAAPKSMDGDPYSWAMHRINETSRGVNNEPAIALQTLPRITKTSPENPDSDTGAVAPTHPAETCEQPLSTLKRRPEAFVPGWLSVLNRLRKERNTYDLQNLFEIWGRIPVGLTGKDLIHEATFTLNCTEKRGELRMETLGTTGRYWGENFENQKIIFTNP